MSQNKIYFKDIAGYETEKKEIMNIVSAINDYEKCLKLNIKIPKGIILQGPPGVGKTLFAKAISNECNFEFLEAFSVNEDSESPLEDLKCVFKKADEIISTQHKPCLVYIDEFDKVLGYDEFRNQFEDSDSRDITRFLLQKLDGFSADSAERILVIASLNDSSSLPESLLRSGRFDRKFNIELPNKHSIVEILKMYTKDIDCFKNIDLESLADLFQYKSGSDIKTIINNVLVDNYTRLDSIDINSFRKSIKEVSFQTTGRKFEKNSALNVLIHELGHSVVGYEMTNDFLDITAIKYNHIYGHADLNRSILDIITEDLDSTKEVSIEEIKETICISLAGYNAEKYILKTVWGGIYGDMSNIEDLIQILSQLNYFGIRGNTMLRVSHDSKTFYHNLANIRAANLLYRLDKKCARIIKKNKTLIKFLADITHHKYNDSLDSMTQLYYYKYYINNKREVNKLYNKVKVKDLNEQYKSLTNLFFI